MDFKLKILIGLYATATVVANITAAKLVSCCGLLFPAGVFFVAISFLMTDVISEVWGRREAAQAVWVGWTAAIFAAIATALTVYLPPAPFWKLQQAYASLFGLVPRITLASLITYLVSQHHDVWMFHLIKVKTGGRHLWLRNNISTMLSQAIDTVLFITLAFSFTVPWNVLLGMMLGQYVVKVILALLDTPFVYLLVAWARGGEGTWHRTSSESSTP